MTAVNPAWVIQASSHPADVFRRMTRFVAQGAQGVRTYVGGDLLVSANGTPNMSVNVAAGEALVNGTQNTTSQGAYHCLNDATVNLTIAASDPTNPRIDIVVAQVQDAAYSGGTNAWSLAVVTGTPAPSPSPPATPNNAIVLAQVAVAANATSITSGNITDTRPRFGTLFKARASLGSAQNAGAASTTKVLLDTKTWDPNGNFDVVTNHQYAVPVSGYYYVAWRIGLVTNNNPQNETAFVFRNNSEMGRGSTFSVRGATAGDDWALVGSDIMLWAAADTIDLRISNSGGNAVAMDVGTDSTYLAIHQLSGN